jgi:hypothetical protein
MPSPACLPRRALPRQATPGEVVDSRSRGISSVTGRGIPSDVVGQEKATFGRSASGIGASASLFSGGLVERRCTRAHSPTAASVSVHRAGPDDDVSAHRDYGLVIVARPDRRSHRANTESLGSDHHRLVGRCGADGWCVHGRGSTERGRDSSTGATRRIDWCGIARSHAPYSHIRGSGLPVLPRALSTFRAPPQAAGPTTDRRRMCRSGA